MPYILFRDVWFIIIAFILQLKTNEEILEVIVKKLKSKRKSLKISQKILAEKSGISLGAIKRLESGQNFTMHNFIAILRVVGELGMLENLLEEKISPKQIHLENKR